jgi:vitamin B12 transporter
MSSPVPSFAVWLMVAAVPAALAQQPPSIFEGQLTVTATGSEESVDEVPLPVTVIGREEMDDSQEESVADLLRRVPGVTLMRTGDEGSPTSIFVRGTESDHTLAMFDGVRLNSPYFSGFDWSLLPTSGLQRIEVARGPFSALWGADAIGGVVNVVPSRAHEGVALSLLGEGGQDNWRRFEGAIGWAGGGFDVYASGFNREGEGELENSDFANDQVLVNAGFSWSEGSRVSVLVQDLGSDIGIPYSNPALLSPNRRQQASERLYAVPLRVRASERWDLEFVASKVDREFLFQDPDDVFGFTGSDTVADTLQVRLASNHHLGAHDLTFGGEWRGDEVTQTTAFGTDLDGETTTVGSLFIQDAWNAGGGLRLILGARWDDADEWGSEISPRASLGWWVSDRVELRAGYGHGFRQPSVGELYFPFSGNPQLEPERSQSGEVGVTWFAGSSRLQANLFANRLDNLIEFDFATYAFANVAEAETHGVEVAWDVPITSGLMSQLQATWLDTSDGNGNPLLRRPEWSSSWTIHGLFWGRLRGDATLIWVGPRADIDAVTFARIRLDGHLTGNLALSYAIWRGFDVLVRAQNIFDADYQEVAGYPAPGRRLTAGLRFGL